jgi:hypothetical protein
MSDDVNKSRRGTPNTLDDIGTGFDAIERIGRRASSRSAEDRADRDRIAQASDVIEGLEDWMNRAPNGQLPPTISRDLGKARETRNKLGPRIRLRGEARQDRALAETRNAVERHFSSRSINGQVSEYMNTESVMGRSMGMMNMSWRDLEEQRGGIMGAIGGIEQSSLNMVDEGLYDRQGRQDPNAMSELKSNYRKRDLLTRKLSVIEATKRQLRSQGLDPESRTEALFSAGAVASKTLFQNQVQGELRSGTGLGTMNVDQLKQKEVQVANELVQALDRLKNSAGASADEVDKLRSSAEHTAQELKRTQEAIRLGGGQGGGGGFTNWMAKWGAGVGGAIAGAGAMYRSVTVDQTNQITGNRSAAAGITNSMYDRRRAALGGDMTALTMMSSDFDARAANEGSINKSNTNIGIGAGLLGGALMVGGGLATLTGVGAAAGVGAMSVGSALLAGAAGSAAVIGGGKLAIDSGTDLARGSVNGTSEALAEQARQINLQEQMSHVTGAQRQIFYNYSMGARGAALAGGGRRGRAFFDQFAGAGGDSMLARMEGASIGTDQFASLAAAGFSSQGSMFNSNQIFAARNLERGGFGDMGTNMGRMGMLASAGSNNPQAGLQSVLEAAFTKSLDSSKALDSMVQNTSAMVQGSVGAAMGFDTTAASSAILGNLVNKDAGNPEFAVNRAATAAERMNGINSGIGVNFADMAGTAGIARAAGVGQVAAMNLKKLDNSTVQSLKDEMDRMGALDPRERSVAEKRFAGRLKDQLGLGQFVDGRTGEVNLPGLSAGISERGKGIFRDAAFMANIDPNTPGYQDLITGKIGLAELKNDPKYGALRDRVGESAALRGLSTDEALTRGAGSVSGSAGADAISGKTPISKAQADADSLATQSFRDMTKEARLAAQQLGGVAEALSKINQASEALAGKLNDKSADDFRSAAAGAAKDFVVGADKFKESVNDFGSILKDFARGANIKLPGDSKSEKH